MQTARDRCACGGELAHRGLQLGELVLVAAEVLDPFRGERNARDRVREAFAGQLDRKPAVVARAQTRGDAHAFFRWTGDRQQQRAEGIEHLRRPFQRALDVGANAFGGLRPGWIAKGRGHRH